VGWRQISEEGWTKRTMELTWEWTIRPPAASFVSKGHGPLCMGLLDWRVEYGRSAERYRLDVWAEGRLRRTHYLNCGSTGLCRREIRLTGALRPGFTCCHSARLRSAHIPPTLTNRTLTRG